MLTLAYLLSFLDRQILSLMVGPIRRDLSLTDTEFSLLHGFAFALFYTFLGIPIARLADNWNRRRLIAIGIAVWSLATAMAGLARNFVQLFAARISVGVGEAALSPAAYSMLADRFPREHLGRAIGIYSSGVFIGIGLSFIIGGLLVSSLEAAGGLYVPGLGTLASWQATFMIVGLPGLLVALLMLTLREPERVASGHAFDQRTDPSAILAWIRRHGRMYLTHFLGFGLLALLFNAIMAWAPEFFIRIHGQERAWAGTRLGLIAAVFGGSGIICGGLFTDWLSRRGELAAPMQAGLIGIALLTPFAIAAPLVADTRLALALFCPVLFFSSFPFGPAASALQMVTPLRMRAQVSAVYLFVVNLLGIGFGGTATALVTDYVFRDGMRLHHAMSSIAAVAGLTAIVMLWLSLRPFRRGHGEILGHPG
ncbi:MAG: MFS transporter [Xanthomonadales bacterium]|nr:MFS transporter [Xanthomonadales bacterium]NIN59233.1 MFS transporter [Xanthomonadales bacterium]NIN74584.1 MFS transporter [Xanthomonadales bacterium]NIO12531.1 MFS transporter [Xanthomonadales bacterium]NIP11626.1 MFS transporter [Xanthomonadales bacterium]